MDFLTLFGVYVVVILTCIALVCKYSGQQQTPFGVIFNSISRVRLNINQLYFYGMAPFGNVTDSELGIILLKTIMFYVQVTAQFLPEWLQRLSQRSLHRLFHQR